MHYRYANHHLEGYTCSSFDSNLGVVKLKLYYFWSWGCFSWIAGWGHLSLTAARFVWSSESSDDCWKCYSETKVGNSWANPTVKGRWVCVLYFVFCSLMTACCLQESAWVQIFNPSPSSVLGFRGRLSCRLYHLVTQWRFWFWDSSLMDKCESYEALPHCLSMCLFCLQLAVKPWWRRWRDYHTNISSSCHLSLHQVLTFHKRSSASGIWGPSSSIHLFLQQAMNF